MFHLVFIVSIEKHPDRSVSKVGCSPMNMMGPGILAAVSPAAYPLNPSMENYSFSHAILLRRLLSQEPRGNIVPFRPRGSKNFFVSRTRQGAFSSDSPIGYAFSTARISCARFLHRDSMRAISLRYSLLFFFHRRFMILAYTAMPAAIQFLRSAFFTISGNE